MKIKYMDIKEFREKGYLQEVNRQFFHPLGLALEVTIDETTNEEKISGIWDCRNDPEGVYYDLSNSSVQRKQKFLDNYEYIQREKMKRIHERMELFDGHVVEPLPKKKKHLLFLFPRRAE